MDAGRDPSELELSLRLYLDYGSATNPERGLTGTKGQMLRKIERLKKIGVSHIVLDPPSSDGFPDHDEEYERFATEVISEIEVAGSFEKVRCNGSSWGYWPVPNERRNTKGDAP